MKTFLLFIEEKTLYRGDKVTTMYLEKNLETGKPVTLFYLRNKEKAGNFGARFGQDIEPRGHYITPIDSPDHHLAKEFPKKYETGTVHFKNPLVIESDENDPTVGWKRKLSAAYGGKKGRRLSKAIIADGYDGIITVSKYGPSETVNLQNFK